VHIVFSTKHREKNLTPEIRERLWKFLGGIARKNKFEAIIIGGYDDHCHALVSLPSSMPVAKAAQLLKGGSSKWISDTFPGMKDFHWQNTYGAFSVSISHIDRTVTYIKNQEEHHKRQTFENEYIGFLEKHHIPFDRDRIFSDDVDTSEPDMG
jgi:putative transposase